MEHRPKSSPRSTNTGGVFRGLEDLIRIAADLAQSVQDSTTVSDTSHTVFDGLRDKLHAVYSVSVGTRGRRPASPRTPNSHRTARREDAREPTADLLDEGDHFLVIAELPGVDEARIRWSITDRTLLISADADGRSYQKRFVLAAAVNPESCVSRYTNGVLELKLWKLPAR